MYSIWNVTIDEEGNRYLQVSQERFAIDLIVLLLFIGITFFSAYKTAKEIERLKKKIKSDQIYIQWLHQRPPIDHGNSHSTSQPQGPACEVP